MEYRIRIQRLKVYGRHGVLPQEKTVGANFYVSIDADVDVEPSAYRDDKLEGTVNYAKLTTAVVEEMQVPSQLLEHVAMRIADRIIKENPTVNLVDVEVEKENPPLGVLCESIGVKITQKR